MRHSTLTFNPVEPSDVGNYRCTATNTHGAVSDISNLQISGELRVWWVERLIPNLPYGSVVQDRLQGYACVHYECVHSIATYIGCMFLHFIVVLPRDMYIFDLLAS